MPTAHSSLPTILVVDDIAENLTLITSMLTGKYRCRVATNGEKALEIAAASPPPDLILLDIAMPGMNGYTVCRHLKANPATKDIPIIFLTSLDGEDDEAQGFLAGGVDYITKPASRAVLLARLETHLVLQQSRTFLSQKNAMLEDMVEARSRQLLSMQDVIILAMASLAETRSNDTSGHIRRVQMYTRELAFMLRRRPEYAGQLDDATLDLLYKTSPLHDIGKVGVPDAILFKPGKLSSDEFSQMKRHSLFGGQTLMEVERRLDAPAEFVSMAHDIALHHHERWDGTGYPLGLKGGLIPLSARIVALADTYDALTSPKIYKNSLPPEEAAEIIFLERGRQFDPAIVDAFAACEERFRAIADMYPDPDPDDGRTSALHHLMTPDHFEDN